MRHYKLNLEERAYYGGYSDLFVVDYTDFNETTADTEQSLELTSGFSPHDVIQTNAIVDLTQVFDGITDVFLKLGFGSAVNRDSLMISSDLKTTELTYVVDASSSLQKANRLEEMTVTLDPGSNGQNLASLTQGKLLIWAQIFRGHLRRDGLQA